MAFGVLRRLASRAKGVLDCIFFGSTRLTQHHITNGVGLGMGLGWMACSEKGVYRQFAFGSVS